MVFPLDGRTAVTKRQWVQATLSQGAMRRQIAEASDLGRFLTALAMAVVRKKSRKMQNTNSGAVVPERAAKHTNRCLSVGTPQPAIAHIVLDIGGFSWHARQGLERATGVPKEVA